MGLNKILQGDIFKVSMLLLLVGSFLMIIVTDVRKLLTKNKKKTIIYGLILVLIFGLVGLLSSSKVLNDTPLNSFIGFQVLFLILGSIHVWGIRRFFSDLSEDKANFFNEFFFSLALLLIGLIAFFRVTSYFKTDFKFIFLASSLVFIVPLLFYKLYEYALMIPMKIYRQWLYPIGVEIKEPTENELKNPLVISFEFKKQLEDDKITNFRVKAPENLEFGKLFYFFLNDYNERHPEEEVQFLNDDNSPQEWIFYRKPSFFRSSKYINPEKTIDINTLKEDDVIICQRT